MLQKSTPQYQAAQKLANELVRISSKQRWNDNTLFKLYFDPFSNFLSQIEKLEGNFAAQMAKTINDKMDPYGYCVANVSNKQAWIIAYAAVENNITEPYIHEIK